MSIDEQISQFRYVDLCALQPCIRNNKLSLKHTALKYNILIVDFLAVFSFDKIVQTKMKISRF